MTAEIKKYKNHLKKVFIFCPKTVEMLEFREELLGILMEKHEELIRSGADEKTAYKKCIASISEYWETIKSLEQTKSNDLSPVHKDMMALGIFSYIMLVVIVYFTASFISGAWELTWLTFIVGGIVFAIYGLSQIAFWAGRKTRYFICRAAIFLANILVSTLLYLTLSFTIVNAWGYTWLIFVLAILVGFILDVTFRAINKVKSYRAFDVIVISALTTIFVYLSVSMFTMEWAFTWLTFVCGLFVCATILFVIKIVENKNRIKRKVKQKTATNTSIQEYKEKKEVKKEKLVEIRPIKERNAELENQAKSQADFADRDDDGNLL